MSLQLRTYANNIVPSAWMDYDLHNVTELSFDAKMKTPAYDLQVYYSTDSGTTWVEVGETLKLTTTATRYNVNISETGEFDNVRIKFVIINSAGTYSKGGQYTLDNITFKGFKA